MENAPQFDRNETREQNFGPIYKIDLASIDMLDCKIDFRDKDMPIEIEECLSEIIRFYKIDHHLIAIQIVTHVGDMLKTEDMVTDSDGNSLTKDSQKIIDFYANDYVKWITEDHELFEYLYDNITNIENPEVSGWTKYYDYPDVRIFYKDEEGAVFGSILTDTIVDTSVQKLLAVWDNLEVFAQLMPEFYDVKYVRKYATFKAIMTGKQ